MSKRINVNPDHYKTAGRERQGEQITQEYEKQQFRRSLAAKPNARILPGTRAKRPRSSRKSGKA